MFLFSNFSDTIHSTKSSKMSLQKKLIPNLSIGIFADIQYADVEDGWNFPKTKKRCYRKAKDCLFELMETFNFYSSSNLEKFSKPINPFPEKTKTVQVLNEKFKSDFEKTIISNSRPIQTIFQLGDLIDNKCSVKGKEENNFPGEGKKSIEMLLKIIEADKETENRQFFHCSGNHEFYNITREDLANKYYYQKKNLFSDTLAFIEPLKEDPSIKIIHLDSYDISYSGRLTNDFKKPENPTDQNYEKFKKAEKLLLENNKNFAASNGKSGENSPQGVPEGDPRARFVAYTGGLSEEQTEWFKNLVINLNADSDTSKIILLSHCQLLPEASDGKIKSNPIWNY